MLSSVFLWLGFLFCLGVYIQPCRKTTLVFSFLSTFLLGIYNLYEVSTVGGLICFIAITNTFFQIIFPASKSQKETFYRLSVAMLIAVCGTVLMANTHADYLPMLGFVITCFAETCVRQNRIYQIYALSTFCWLAYAVMHGDLVYSAMNTILFLVNILVLFPNYKTKIGGIKPVAMIRIKTYIGRVPQGE